MHRDVIMLKILPSLLVLVSATSAEAKSPQIPIAEGPFESVLQATEAARNCGFQELRVRIRSERSQLFIDGSMPSNDIRQCLWSWMTPRGKDMNFAPRWWKDDFTRDHP